MFNVLKLHGYFKITNFFGIKLTFKKIIFTVWIIFTLVTCSFLRNLLVGYVCGLSNYFVFFLFSLVDVLTFIKTLLINSGRFNWLNSQSLDYGTRVILIHCNLFFANFFFINYNYIITFYLNIFLGYKVFFTDILFN